MREIRVQSLGWEDLLEKKMATHSSTLAWKIPWMEKPGRLQSMGSQRVGHDWATPLSLSLCETVEGSKVRDREAQSAMRTGWSRLGFRTCLWQMITSSDLGMDDRRPGTQGWEKGRMAGAQCRGGERRAGGRRGCKGLRLEGLDVEVTPQTAMLV